MQRMKHIYKVSIKRIYFFNKLKKIDFKIHLKTYLNIISLIYRNMKFCKECENKLFPSEEDGKLWNKCIDCGFKEEYSNTIIDKKNYKIINN